MKSLFLSLILFSCISCANCEDNSQSSENQEGETILVKSQSNKSESPHSNSTEIERDKEMLGLLAGTIQGEIISDDMRNAAIAENNNI